jgi:hypothetical protein
MISVGERTLTTVQDVAFSDVAVLKDFARNLPGLGPLALLDVMSKAAETGESHTTDLFNEMDANPRKQLSSSDACAAEWQPRVCDIKGQ